MPFKLLSFAVLLALFVPVLSGCDSDDDDDDPPPLQNIVELAQGTDDLSTLVAALIEADLVTTLQGDGPFTVFAPTNAAFEALLADLQITADELLARDDLGDILTYHVVPGEAFSGDLSDGQMLMTVEGSMLEVDINGPTISLIGETNTVTVTTPNIDASNGVVHLIDAVLLPESGPTQNIVELAQATPDLSTLVTALIEAELVATLQGPGPFTVFAPVNSAFDALGAEIVGRLLEDDNQALLQKVLTYHVVPGRILAADLMDGQMPTTVEGSTLEIDLDGGPTVNGVDIIATDILATNGVVHLIDEVLLQNLDVVDVAVVQGFSTLATALTEAELITTLRGDGPFTVFAPTNDAFDALLGDLEITVEELLARDDLGDILTYHVVEVEAFSGDLIDGQVLTTIEGSTLEVDITGGVISLIGETNTVVVGPADLDASNGVVHAIDAVLLPGE
ncbi:MAG: fasciclin domain-containing protein [Bacteroidota bacterium]